MIPGLNKVIKKRRNGIYYLRFSRGKTPDGKRDRFVKSLETRNMTEARKCAAALFEVERKKTREDNSHEEVFTLETLFEQYLLAHTELRPGSCLSYRSSLKDWVKFFGKKFLIRDLTLGKIKDYREQLKSRNLSDDTQHHYLKSLKLMLNWGYRMKLVEFSSVLFFDVPPQKNETVKYWSREDVERIVETLRGEGVRHVLILALARTGQRINSVLHLKWSWINFDKGLIEFDKEFMKGKKNLRFPMTPDLQRYLFDLRNEASASAEYVFSDDGGQTPISEPRYMLKKVLERLGLKGHFHMFRHSFSTNFLSLGKDGDKNYSVESLTRLMGWHSIDMALKYAHVTPEYSEAQREAVNGVAGLADDIVIELGRAQNPQKPIHTGATSIPSMALQMVPIL